MSNYIFYNPNPNQRYKKDGTPMKWHGTDCTVRALSKAMDWTWVESFKYLCETAIKLQMTFDDIKVLQKVYEKLGFTKHGYPVKTVKPTINEFCKQNPKGTFIISCTGHVVCIHNGKIYDTWNCGDCKVRSYYSK